MNTERRACRWIRAPSARRAGQRGLGAVSVLLVIAAMLGFADSARAQSVVVELRSGQVAPGVPGVPSQVDMSVERHTTTSATGPLGPFNPAWFKPSSAFVSAFVADLAPGFLPPADFCDPQARWISHSNPSRGQHASVLYAIPFHIDRPLVCRAELEFCWAVDDRLGDAGVEAVYINGEPIPGISGGTFSSATTVTVPIPIQKLPLKGVTTKGTNWLYIYARNTLPVESGLIFSATIRGWDCPPCADPPRNMVLWMPFDEQTGTRTRNILLSPSGDGTLFDTVNLGATGPMGNAAYFGQGHIDVQPYPALELDNDLTIDAWLKLKKFTTVPREHTIVDMRHFDPPGSIEWTGYRLYVNLASTSNRRLTLEYKDDPGALFTGKIEGPFVIAENVWQHLTVVVDRHARYPGSMDATFYINGFAPPQLGGIPQPVPGPDAFGDLGTGVLRIGNVLGPHEAGKWLWGWIDELEIFDRALDPIEVIGIARAFNGKCRGSCNVEWDRSFYGSQQSIQVPAQLCNNTSAAQTYALAINPLACGPIASPTGIAFAPTPPITVPAGSCSTVWLTIPRPPFTALGQASCYELVMTNVATGAVTACQGSVQWSPFVVIGPPTSGGGTLASGSTLQMGFPVQNPGGATTIAYRVSAIGPDMEPDTSAMSLDDAAPGTLIEGVLDLPAGAETSIELTARFVEDDPWKWYAVLLEMDLDGDGSFEAMESVSLMNALEDPCPPTIVEDFEFYIPGSEPCGIAGLGGMGGWQPWPGSTDVCGMVTTDEAFSGMRSLRIDGAMGGSTGLGDDMVRQFDLTSGRHVLTMQTLVPAGASGRGWVAMLSEFPAPFNWALNLMLDADAGVIRDEQNAGLSTPLVFGDWIELEVIVDLDADTVDATYNGIRFIAGKSWTLGVPPSGPATFKALDLYADEPGRGTSGMYFDDIELRTLCEPAADPCIADCDGSGTLDLFDFLCFQNAFAAGDLSADLDGDGALTLFDFLAFQNAFAAGCP